ncbi:TlpA family protein disulfide reductase [Sinanaerobacter chloroacetimidivorans]|uniref:TlpA family protein disulfide reductase n=1 Tax=Sinanaerobacter chloroacetimidivorans TaxID=2818044 RepID=A0A8J7W3M4_9FIRM|nr:TlpA disulfide reductase family protein [Sinanaerobacter chloroacetimidivorans]MBR0598486.1 TlpA family protein disulfide reductase [Sinanaerobacter chloroacetimidivorans]
MNSKSKTIIGAVAFIVFLVFAYFAYTTLSDNYNKKETLPDTSSSQNATKQAAPDFTVYDAQGNEVRLSDFKGKPVVLNFWASWCPPCKGEMPHFNEVYADEKDNVVFIMVDMVDGQRETQKKGQQYVGDQGFDLPVYFYNQQQAAATYGISSIPTTVFIDKDGNIVTGYQGAIDKETLLDGIKSINSGTND